MGKSPCCSKEGLNKGAWTAMEDKILTEYIETHGEGKWRHLPKRAGLKRCGKSCRLRWLNYLRPGIKRGNITNDEEELIIRLHNLLGNRWSLIAGRLPGRTDNEIKNYWNTNIGRKLQNGIITTPNCSITSGGVHISSLNSAREQQQGRYMKTTQEWHTSPHPPNKGSYNNNNVVQTKATRWTTKVTVTKEITQQNEGVIENINVVDNKILKGSPVVSSPSENNINDPLLLDNFVADFDDEMDENFFSELLKMDVPELSCLENNMLLEDNGNPSSTVDKGQYYLSPKSSNDTHFSWGDSLYGTGFDFQTTATIMESGFDWL